MIIAEEQQIEEEVASSKDKPLALFDDRIGAFAAYTIAADLLKLREIYAGYLMRITDDAWARRTERRACGWTLLETLAHLDAISGMFNTSVELALASQPIIVPGITTRSDLRAANRAAIDGRLHLGPTALTESFLASLAYGAQLASGLSLEQLAITVDHPYYSGRPTVAEIFGTSLIHAGMIHGAQVATGARGQPIWNFYDPGMMRRQLTRAFHTMGLAYWPERGGELHATLAFNIAGQGGGSWYIRVDPSDSQGQIGTVRTADMTLSFASADLFCQIATLQTGIWPLVLMRKLRIQGNLRLASRISRLFILT